MAASRGESRNNRLGEARESLSDGSIQGARWSRIPRPAFARRKKAGGGLVGNERQSRPVSWLRSAALRCSGGGGGTTRKQRRQERGDARSRRGSHRGWARL